MGQKADKEATMKILLFGTIAGILMFHLIEAIPVKSNQESGWVEIVNRSQDPLYIYLIENEALLTRIPSENAIEIGSLKSYGLYLKK